MQKHDRSESLFAQALEVIPGGVDSPVRAYGSVGGTPLFIARGQGAHIVDADGNRYLDYVCSWGPLVLGHAHHRVVGALRDLVMNGTSFGAPSPLEVALARTVVDTVPSKDLVRFMSSGTEANMTALRLARAHTGRDGIIKFAGGYHGHTDALLVEAGSGSATLGVPSSAGVPAAFAGLTLVAEYNDLDSVEALLQANREGIAAVIVEPVAANMGVVAPAPGFLEGLRELTLRYGAVLIFDEVISGFRVAPGGAQELYGVTPDLTCLGKIIGGGLPVGAVGGRRDIMELLAPLGPVYQAGTLSGNPLAMAAGSETLAELLRPGAHEKLETLSAHLEEGLAWAIAEVQIAARVQRVGSVLTLFFTAHEVTDFPSASRSDRERFGRFFHGMLERGFYLPPSQFEAWFVSLAHTQADIEATVDAAREAMAGLA
jgi:glutamate-1-semialdehyde 2,1-aminomutase